MHIAPSLVLILSLTACEHAGPSTSSSTTPAESAPAEPAPAAVTPAANAAPATPAPGPPAPATPAAAVVAPKPAPAAPAAKTVAPTAKPSLLGKDCTHYRATRAAPKWNANCEGPRVTKKPTAAADSAPAAQPEGK